MKQLLLSIFLFISYGALAQITLTNASFPQIGDTLRVAIDGMPENINITAPGGDQTWDYTNLASPFVQEIIYREASEGSVANELPNANAFTGDAQTGELYYNISDNNVELVAFNGPDPAGFNILTLVKFDPPLLERKAPLNFFDQNFSEANILVPISAELLPEELLGQFPLVPDSLRLRINQNQTDLVDGWGTLDIPGGSFEVLREKQRLISNNRVDILLPIIGWQDVTDLVIDGIGISDGLGQDTTVTYNFYSNDAKEVIASVEVDNQDETPISVTYKFIDVIDNVPVINTSRPNIFAYPNPAISDTRFDFTNLDNGNYTLKIYNILGVEIWKQNYYVRGNRTEKVDLANFRKGTYLYSLIDSSGKILTTKRLIILRP